MTSMRAMFLTTDNTDIHRFLISNELENYCLDWQSSAFSVTSVVNLSFGYITEFIERCARMNGGGMYDYEGSIRLQLWFETPNQAAAFLAMLVFACLALAAFFDSSGKSRAATIGARFCLGGKITAIALSCLCAVLIALTYSRGGYLSLFGAGLFALGILRLRVWILIPAIIAFAIAAGYASNGDSNRDYRR